MRAQYWHMQSQEAGALRETLRGISSLVKLEGYDQFRAAVAYATLSGCKILLDEIGHSARWKKCAKRWLISIDFGRTEPAAFKFLSALPKAEVRVPNGKKVVATPGFMPSVPFHPKVYSVDNVESGKGSVFGIFLGSGNLTGSALLTGSECGALSYWTSPTGPELKEMMKAHQRMAWFDAVWDEAVPVADVIGDYTAKWKKSKPPIPADNPTIVSLYLGGGGHVVSGNLALELTSARALWVEVGELYKNRGPSESGNQVDLSRGSRVFFGFSPAGVPRNTILGHVMLRNDGFAAVECSLRFGNNQMDKTNLPVPGADGPSSYDNSMILFERAGIHKNGLPKFHVRKGSANDLKKWRAASLSDVSYQMKGGRRWGLLFA